MKSKKQKFVIVTREFGIPIYIAPLKNGECQETDKLEEAEVWSYEDTVCHPILDKVTGETISIKLYTYRHLTGFSGLVFEPK